LYVLELFVGFAHHGEAANGAFMKLFPLKANALPAPIVKIFALAAGRHARKTWIQR